MKPTNLILVASLVCFSFFTSCKKTEATRDADAVVEATYELTADNAVSDYMAEDDNDILMEAGSDKGLLGNFAPPTESNNFLACATVTVTPQTGFPKTMVIVFDSTCTNNNGVVRSGTIRIVISDSLRRPGSTAVMTFENYFVNRFKREGTHTFTNTSVAGGKSWQRRVVGGKITAPSGFYWLHESLKNVTQTAGVSTLTFFDDIFSVTGNSSVTNMLGVTRTATILTALQKKYECHNIDKGTIRFQGPNHFAILDYGNGTCDRLATISIDGHTPRIITLP